MMGGLTQTADRAVLVGTETGDDAGVYALDDERALVVTADFITPVADDPFRFGEIAAANSISDVYAMGGQPLTAVALCLFPKALDAGVAREILDGGQKKANEAGVQVLGGHTVRNEELLYGLSVTGIVHPARILRNVGIRPGDVLVLTKPLGTGLLINGRRKGLGSDEDFRAALESMARLNRSASRAALAASAHAATDVTGFGLVGHALKMARGSGVTIRFDAGAFPILRGALGLAAAGVTTAATKKNREIGAAHLRSEGSIPPLLDQILHDPQTSGGLLLAVAADQAALLLRSLHEAGIADAARIGEAILDATPHLFIAGDFNLYR